MKGMVFGTRGLKSWVLGPIGYYETTMPRVLRAYQACTVYPKGMEHLRTSTGPGPGSQNKALLNIDSSSCNGSLDRVRS